MIQGMYSIVVGLMQFVWSLEDIPATGRPSVQHGRRGDGLVRKQLHPAAEVERTAFLAISGHGMWSRQRVDVCLVAISEHKERRNRSSEDQLRTSEALVTV